VLHRHRRFWIAPDRFDLSRFLPDWSPPPRFAYMPFGAGPRICVGNPFALTELVLVVATMVRSFHVSLAPHRPMALVGIVTIQPDVPPPFRLTRRLSDGSATTLAKFLGRSAPRRFFAGQPSPGRVGMRATLGSRVLLRYA